jgi:sarcosine oxidase, subunit gamma
VAELHALPSWTEPAHHGASGMGVTLAEATIATAWNVHGDLARKPFADAAQRQFGTALPAAPNTTARSGALHALWLGPRSWLLVTGDPEALADLTARRDAFNAAGGALFDVSASRIAWTISGQHATDVLMRGCPLDFHPRAFAAGACAQSLYGHVGLLVVKRDETPAFTLMVARSYARDVWHSLLVAAAPFGAAIDAPAPYA